MKGNAMQMSNRGRENLDSMSSKKKGYDGSKKGQTEPKMEAFDGEAPVGHGLGPKNLRAPRYRSRKKIRRNERKKE